MVFWDNIINTSMIGTDKRQLSNADLTEGLAKVLTVVNSNDAADKEQQFLQLAAVAFNYRQSGVMPLQKEIAVPPAPAEEKNYCTEAAMQVLKDIVTEENLSLLQGWLQLCKQKSEIVQPAILPALLELAAQNKKMQSLVASCCGRRGEWLGRFNDNWNFSMAQTPAEIWETGTPQQRKDVLETLRKQEPAVAREWLQKTWDQEDAATKAELLNAMNNSISEADIPFLEHLAGEKSKKVKEAALALLKKIPGSPVILQYQDVMKRSFSLDKKKTMLGLGSKNILTFRLPDNIPDEIFKSGIEKLAGTMTSKTLSDESYILYQLTGFIPPSFWEEQLNCTPAEVIELFAGTEEGKKLVPAIGLAAGRFKAANWAACFTSMKNTFYIDLVELLPKKQQEEYLAAQLKQGADGGTLINVAVRQQEEWGLELARVLFQYMASNPYNYNRAFFNQNISLVPPSIEPELKQFAPAEEYLRNTWNNVCEHISKLLSYKTNTIKAFNL